jgi:hypothetical protein
MARVNHGPVNHGPVNHGPGNHGPGVDGPLAAGSRMTDARALLADRSIVAACAGSPSPCRAIGFEIGLDIALCCARHMARLRATSWHARKVCAIDPQTLCGRQTSAWGTIDWLAVDNWRSAHVALRLGELLPIMPSAGSQLAQRQAL